MSYLSNGERRPNFSTFTSTGGDGGSSSYLNRQGASNGNKPGDVKKIYIKNFKRKLQWLYWNQFYIYKKTVCLFACRKTRVTTELFGIHLEKTKGSCNSNTNLKENKLFAPRTVSRC